MKKFLAVFLAVIMAAACMAGCGNTGGDTGAAADWPEKGISLVVCYTAGGTADTANRQLASLMSESLGVDITVTNVTGGSGSIAGLQVAAAKPDGNTWLGDVAHTVSGWRTLDYADMGWEDYYGFYAATAPYVIFVSKDSPYNTYQELYDAMAKNPNMKWGNAGLGSINQLTGQLMLDFMGLTGNSIPYDGGRDAAIKVIAGEVVWSWAGVSDIMDLAQSGDIKILGVCNAEPITVEAAGGAYEAPSLLTDHPELSSLEGLLYWGFQVSRDTPPEAVAKIRQAFEAAVETDEWAEYCASMGLTPSVGVGQESDDLCARLECIYAWGLYDAGMGAEGVSPADFGIPRIDEYTFPGTPQAAEAAAWPQ